MNDTNPIPTRSSPEEVELVQLIDDVLWSEKAHFVMCGMLRQTHLVTGLVATAASATAAATIVTKSNTTLAGLAALIAAIAAGLLTFLKPEEAARRHLSSGRQLGKLRVEMRQALTIDLPNGTEIRDQLREFATRKATIHDESPHIPDIAVKIVARRRVQ